MALTPGLALAQCSYGKQASMSCADGTVYDEKAQGCVPVSS
ncbi:hypothetical protein ILP92_10100 [Maribius pontilimi]|uniref:Chitin-binding type-2 domain-containing protein n=1 Tax=Palleronia pontilimi TaxID=1964209 RepID=A0A934ME56_9RHOB|nr:hypothetical protein [Palleronia pontilimi]